MATVFYTLQSKIAVTSTANNARSRTERVGAVTDSESDCVCDAVTDSSIPGMATYIMDCFFTGHIICAYVWSIYHSSLLRYCLLCALFQHLVVSKLSRWYFARHAVAWSLRAALSAILWSPSTRLVCRSSEMNWEMRKRPEAAESLKTKWMAATSQIWFALRKFGPAQNEHPCGPNLRSLAPLGQQTARSTGPNWPGEWKKPAGHLSMSRPGTYSPFY